MRGQCAFACLPTPLPFAAPTRNRQECDGTRSLHRRVTKHATRGVNDLENVLTDKAQTVAPGGPKGSKETIQARQAITPLPSPSFPSGGSLGAPRVARRRSATPREQVHLGYSNPVERAGRHRPQQNSGSGAPANSRAYTQPAGTHCSSSLPMLPYASRAGQPASAPEGNSMTRHRSSGHEEGVPRELPLA